MKDIRLGAAARYLAAVHEKERKKMNTRSAPRLRTGLQLFTTAVDTHSFWAEKIPQQPRQTATRCRYLLSVFFISVVWPVALCARKGRPRAGDRTRSPLAAGYQTPQGK